MYKNLVIFSAVLGICYSANILGILPTASFSHQIPFRPIWRELSLRGHKVTVMTTDPMKDSTLTNLTEINMHYTYEIFRKHKYVETLSDDKKSFMEMANILGSMMNETLNVQLSSPEVQKLIHDENVKFDLVIIESLAPTSLAFERLISFIYQAVYKILVYYKYYPKEDLRIKKFFGENIPTLLELKDNMSMLFVSINPIFHNVRPVNPNTILIGTGLHINPPKDLPKDLQAYLDSGKEGVIYFSLGSNVKGSLLDDKVKREIFNAFAELPYKVLMKLETNLTDIPKNVRVEKWLPQQDVLRHPNIKLFISQGGLQSLQESITNGIPLVGIPFFGDQISNVQKMVKRGYGVKVDKKEITKENLKAAILKVLSNPEYRETAKKMGEILHDEPMTSLEKAIWWIEYVIRHKGAPHLRSPAVDLPFYKYYMLDVIGFVLAVTFTPIFIMYKLLKCLLKKLFKSKSKAKKE